MNSSNLEILAKYFPEEVLSKIRERLGITELYPTQLQAIKSGVLDHENIILAAPTASGKTLVAELAALKTLLEGGKVLYTAPLRALASEKYEEFKGFFSLFGYETAISTGDFDSDDPWLEKYDVIVTTNEKADSLLRHKARWISKVTLLVVDEIHVIGSDKRGATLEVFLTRMKLASNKPQILGLSATVGNLEELAEWLGAKPVRVDWRPVPLKEGVYYEGEVFFGDGTHLSLGVRETPLHDLVYDTLEDEGQVLVFSPTRRSSVSDARKLSVLTSKFVSPQDSRVIREHVRKLRALYSDKVTLELLELLPKGVAFHHAGLGPEARKTVENLFRNRVLKAVVATPTLAAGVNLPARRVVITDYRRFNVELGYYERIPVMEYKQMAGRAGRPRYDKEGEAILIARSLQELEFLMREYVYAQPEKLHSQLSSEPVMRSQLLSVVATSDLVRDFSTLERFLSNTLYYHQNGSYFVVENAKSVIRKLSRAGLIELKDSEIKPTLLGIRVAELYIDPETALKGIEFFKMKCAAQTLSYLLLLSSTPDMQTVHLRRGDEEWLEEVLTARKGELCFNPPADEIEYQFFLQQLKTALLLEDWINEVHEDTIIENYDVGPGDVYAITQTAEWIAFALAEVAKITGYTDHALQLSVLSKRIKHGVREELLDLVSLRGIGRVRARSLYNHGYKSLIDIALAREEDLARVPGIGRALARAIKLYLSSSSEEIRESDEIGEEESTRELASGGLDSYF